MGGSDLRIRAVKKNYERQRVVDAETLPPLAHFAGKGELGPIQKLLADSETDVNKGNKNGLTPLMVAVVKARIDVTQLLLDGGADVNRSDIANFTALNMACEVGACEIVKMLLDAGADPNKGADTGNTPLVTAAMAGHASVVALLISAGADVGATTPNGCASLAYAADFGHLSTLEVLLSHVVDINAENNRGQTALFLACEKGHVNVAHRLLSQKTIEVDTADVHGHTPLMAAAASNHASIVRLLLNRPDVNVSGRDRNGATALMLAAAAGHIAPISVLLQWRRTFNEGADTTEDTVNPNCCRTDGSTALMDAALNGHTAAFNLLLAGGANPCQINFNRYNVLMIACNAGHAPIVAILLKLPNVPVEYKNTSGQTALVLAAIRGHVDIVRLLLEFGARVNTGEDVVNSPFHIACLLGMTEVIHMLLPYCGEYLSLGLPASSHLIDRSDEMVFILHAPIYTPIELANLRGNDTCVAVLRRWMERFERRCATCNVSEEPAHLFACAACLEVFFCSISCQNQGWISGHEEACGRRIRPT